MFAYKITANKPFLFTEIEIHASLVTRELPGTIIFFKEPAEELYIVLTRGRSPRHYKVICTSQA
jgi:hypothetical protein